MSAQPLPPQPSLAHSYFSNLRSSECSSQPLQNQQLHTLLQEYANKRLQLPSFDTLAHSFTDEEVPSLLESTTTALFAKTTGGGDTFAISTRKPFVFFFPHSVSPALCGPSCEKRPRSAARRCHSHQSPVTSQQSSSALSARGARAMLKVARPEWRNGRRGGLKIRWPQGCVGSTPSSGTSFSFVQAFRKDCP